MNWRAKGPGKKHAQAAGRGSKPCWQQQGQVPQHLDGYGKLLAWPPASPGGNKAMQWSAIKRTQLPVTCGPLVSYTSNMPEPPVSDTRRKGTCDHERAGRENGCKTVAGRLQEQ